MAPLAATAFQNNFAGEEFRPHGSNPAKKLFRVSFVGLGEVSPLPTELCGCVSFVRGNLVEIREAWDAPRDRKYVPPATAQLAFQYLRAVAFVRGELKLALTGRTLKILEQGLFH